MAGQTFFEAMGIAGLEKIHSQMIVWIINNEELTVQTKKEILKGLFPKVALDEQLGNNDLYGMTEFNDGKSIDIILRAGEQLFIIENKVTSSQHDDQLKEYEKIVEDNRNMNEEKKNGFFKGINKPEQVHYAFLSLIPEDPKGVDKTWIKISYKTWHSILDKNWGQLSKELSERNRYIMEDYRDSLNNMVIHTGSFLDGNPNSYKNVFLKPSKKDKFFQLRSGEYSPKKAEEYIAQQNMETIMQKAFFIKVVKAMNLEKDDLCKYAETYANALCDIVHLLPKDQDGNEYAIGIQFQNDTMKIFYRHYHEKESKKSKKADLPSTIIEQFEKIAVERRYKINKARTREWCSVSKKLPHKYSELTFNENRDMLQASYNEAVDIIDSYFSSLFSASNWHK